MEKKCESMRSKHLSYRTPAVTALSSPCVFVIMGVKCKKTVPRRERKNLGSRTRNAPLPPLPCLRGERDRHVARVSLEQPMGTCSIQLTSHTILWLQFFSGLRQHVSLFQESQQPWEDVLVVLSKQAKCMFTWGLI